MAFTYLTAICKSTQSFLNSTLLAVALSLGCGAPLPLDNTTSPPSEEQVPPIQNPQIAYVAETVDGERLIIADKDGATLNSYELPFKLYRFSAPCWSSDGSKLILFSKGTNNLGLFILDAKTGSLESLVQNSNWSYRYPRGSEQGDLAFLANEIIDGESHLRKYLVLKELKLNH